jgi:hypothetical protein
LVVDERDRSRLDDLEVPELEVPPADTLTDLYLSLLAWKEPQNE